MPRPQLLLADDLRLARKILLLLGKTQVAGADEIPVVTMLARGGSTRPRALLVGWCAITLSYFLFLATAPLPPSAMLMTSSAHEPEKSLGATAGLPGDNATPRNRELTDDQRDDTVAMSDVAPARRDDAGDDRR